MNNFENDLIGKWQVIDSKSFLDISSDGSFIANNISGDVFPRGHRLNGMNLDGNGNWIIVDNSRIEFRWLLVNGKQADSSVFAYMLHGNEMKFYFNLDDPDVFDRLVFNRFKDK